MKPLAKIKSWFGGRTLDGSPVAAVSSDPVQWWQKGLDVGNRPAGGATAAAEGGIDAYAQATAQLPGRHFKLLDSGGKEKITTSALSRILRNPNHYQTSSDFIMFMVRQLLSNGNAYSYAIRNDRSEVESLHPLPFGSCTPVIEAETKELFYSVRANQLMPTETTFLIPARDVLHLKLYTPYHPLVGVSPLTYAALAMSANVALSSHMATFFNNMARPSYLLSTDLQLTADQMRQLRAAWEEQSKQMSSGGVPILSSGMKAQSLGLTSQDSQLVEAFRMTVEDIGRALRIPLPLMGINTTYSSTEALMGFWLATGLGFMVNHIEKAYEKFFNLPDGQFVEFDTDALMRTDFLARVDAVTKGVIGGVFSPNEGRAMFELPGVEYGEEPRVQQQVVPLSQVALTPSAPATEPTPTAPPADVQETPEKSFDGDFLKDLVTLKIKGRAA